MTTTKTAIRRKIQALNEEQIIAILADVSKLKKYYSFICWYLKLIQIFLGHTQKGFRGYEKIVYRDEINGEKFLVSNSLTNTYCFFLLLFYIIILLCRKTFIG